MMLPYSRELENYRQLLSLAKIFIRGFFSYDKDCKQIWRPLPIFLSLTNTKIAGLTKAMQFVSQHFDGENTCASHSSADPNKHTKVINYQCHTPQCETMSACARGTAPRVTLWFFDQFKLDLHVEDKINYEIRLKTWKVMFTVYRHRQPRR